MIIEYEDEHVEVLETESSPPNIIIFQADKMNPEELKECETGDYVNFWTPDSEPTKIHIFRRGSVGGSGRIGYVPNNYQTKVPKPANIEKS